MVELKDKLSLEEAYEILEAVYVDVHNKNVAQEKNLEKTERNSRGVGRTW